jgi:hypothetical protein
MMKNKQKPVKKTFLGWIHRNRLKIVLISFLVIVPITLILTIYIGSFVNNNKVHFDQEVTQETIYIKDFIEVNPSKLDIDENFYYTIDQIDAFELHLRWDELILPVKNETTGELENGVYKFKTYYAQNDGFNVSSLNITPVLQTEWTDIRAIGPSLGVQTSIPVSANLNIQFNYRLPVRPLLFVKLESPMLYLRLNYVLQVAGSPLNKTAYIQFDLDQVNPRTVN